MYEYAANLHVAPFQNIAMKHISIHYQKTQHQATANDHSVEFLSIVVVRDWLADVLISSSSSRFLKYLQK